MFFCFWVVCGCISNSNNNTHTNRLRLTHIIPKSTVFTDIVATIFIVYFVYFSRTKTIDGSLLYVCHHFRVSVCGVWVNASMRVQVIQVSFICLFGVSICGLLLIVAQLVLCMPAMFVCWRIRFLFWHNE